ncbi:MAG TPA: 4Fe-4S single cluster domain-containing protein [Candidatus Ozemobacteraceae bacterium]|nr:4Fe-4S single cluster domain-containing protein [Candidatus Ozemobacteraceae bacterium]
MQKVRIHKFIGRTAVEGPGERACLWVQGCPIRCPGCFNPETWPFEAGEEAAVDDLYERVLREDSIEGMTFLGGEPFAQAAPLAELAWRLRERGLSIVTFTGYTLEALRAASNSAWNRLIDATDLLIDGPYIQAQADQSRPWIGSANQRYLFLTDRYRHLEPSLSSIPNGLEIRIGPDGQVSINGMDTADDLEAIKTTLRLP